MSGPGKKTEIYSNITPPTEPAMLKIKHNMNQQSVDVCKDAIEQAGEGHSFQNTTGNIVVKMSINPFFNRKNLNQSINDQGFVHVLNKEGTGMMGPLSVSIDAKTICGKGTNWDSDQKQCTASSNCCIQ